MKSAHRIVFAAAMFASLTVAAQAVTISNASVTIGGTTYNTPTGNSTGEGFSYIPGPTSVGDGIEFHSVNDIVGDNGVASDTKIVTFSYTVTADPGYNLNWAQVSPGISGEFGQANVSLSHSGNLSSSTFFFPDSNTSYVDPYAVAVSAHSYVVTGSYTITAYPHSSDGFGYVYADHVGVTYTEQAVPEPASIAALAIGGLGILGRRRKK